MANQTLGRKFSDTAQAHGAQGQLTHGMEKVGYDQPHGTDLAAVLSKGRTPGNNEKAHAQKDKAHAEFKGNRRIFIAQFNPKQGDSRGQGDDKQGVNVLQPAGGYFPAQHYPVGRVAGEQVEGSTGLFKTGKENDGPQKEDGDHGDAFTLILVFTGKQNDAAKVKHGNDKQNISGVLGKVDNAEIRGALCPEKHGKNDEQGDADAVHKILTGLDDHLFGAGFAFHQTGVAQNLLTGKILNHTQGHTDTGGQETQMPVDFFTHPGTYQLSQKGAHINTHIENGKSGITATAAFGIKIANNGAYIGF